MEKKIMGEKNLEMLGRTDNDTFNIYKEFDCSIVRGMVIQSLEKIVRRAKSTYEKY